MSRIPVFIEKKNRKNWNKTAETCIFISCESNTTNTSEFEDSEEPSNNDLKKLEADTALEKFTNRADNVKAVSVCSDDEDSVRGIKFNSDFINEDDRHSGVSNTSISLTVVSCSKGIVNATCNCKLCQSVGDKTLATSAESCIEVAGKASCKTEMGVGNDLIEEFGKVAKTRSLIPKLTPRLTAGIVSVTPAPVKRNKSKKVKNCNTELKVEAPAESDSRDLKNQLQNLDTGSIKKSQTTSKRIEMRNGVHSLPNELGSDTEEKCHKIVIKSKRMLDTDEAFVVKSFHDFEDSEPECAQHEHKKTQVFNGMEINTDKEILLRVELEDLESNTGGEIDNKAEDSVFHSKDKREAVGSPSSDRHFSVNPNRTEGKLELVTDLPRKRPISNGRSLVRSQIPVFICSSPKRSSGSPSPVRSSPSVSRESSQSPVRNSFSIVDSSASKLPPKSPVYSRRSPLVTKRRPLSSRSNSASASPHCVSVKSPSLRNAAEQVPTSLTKLSSLAQKQIKLFRSNNHIKQTVPHEDVPINNAPKIILNRQSKLQSENTDSSLRRNLPKAPEKRILRYGQRCMAGENYQGTGNAGVPASKGVSAPQSTANKKRPPWDLKGRLQDMEEKMKLKDHQMAEWSEQIGTLLNQNSQLTGTVAEREEVASSIGKEKEYLQKKLMDTETELHTIKSKFDRETENFEFTKASLRRQKESLENELSALQTEAAGLKSSIAQLTSAQAGLKSELSSTQMSLNKALRDCQERDDTIVRITNEKDSVITRLTMIIKDNNDTIADYDKKFRDFETERRKLHNTVQELKGNIRVFCRVRPLIGEELLGNDGEIQHMNFPDDDHRTVELEKLADINLSESTINGTKRAANGRYTFSFDKVFLPESTQAEVFEEICQLVQSALDGYNVCIFAYGQTGSGKTYTMEGPSMEDEETMGMISRAMVQIFSTTKDLEEKGWQYELEASFLEIYNETIRDLLVNHGPDVKHEIKLGTNGKDVTVTNLTSQMVTHKEQIMTLLRTASTNRAVGETQSNERSSRSHSVFRLKIRGTNEITGENCAGSLNLIDLAGSERLKESGATGQRLKETQNINKSLANLGNVIMALGNKEPHVPYRNSKLTYLLQNSLGGNSKTLMFVNVSPREEHFSESVNSLRFATKVNQCNIGTATKKIR